MIDFEELQQILDACPKGLRVKLSGGKFLNRATRSAPESKQEPRRQWVETGDPFLFELIRAKISSCQYRHKQDGSKLSYFTQVLVENCPAPSSRLAESRRVDNRRSPERAYSVFTVSEDSNGALDRVVAGKYQSPHSYANSHQNHLTRKDRDVRKIVNGQVVSKWSDPPSV